MTLVQLGTFARTERFYQANFHVRREHTQTSPTPPTLINGRNNVSYLECRRTMRLTGRVPSSLCPEGFACPFGTGGTANPRLSCAIGHACPAGSPSPTANPCPHGTFSNSTSLTSLSDCTPCPAGFYCTGGQPNVSGSCAKGHYCPMRTNVSDAFPCVSGTFMSHVREGVSLISLSIYASFSFSQTRPLIPIAHNVLLENIAWRAPPKR